MRRGTFDEVARRADRDVVIELFAPGCAHCVSLAPTLDELAMLFAAVPSVVVAAMDATANDAPADLDVDALKLSSAGGDSGYPQLFLVPAAAGAAAVPFEEEPTLERLAMFVRSRGAISIDAAVWDDIRSEL